MVNIALIGAGGVSKRHVAAWAKVDKVNVVGVADLDAELAQTTAAKLGSKLWTTDYHELLRPICILRPIYILKPICILRPKPKPIS